MFQDNTYKIMIIEYVDMLRFSLADIGKSMLIFFLFHLPTFEL